MKGRPNPQKITPEQGDNVHAGEGRHPEQPHGQEPTDPAWLGTNTSVPPDQQWHEVTPAESQKPGSTERRDGFEQKKP